jgi:uncharacterized membrane protein
MAGTPPGAPTGTGTPPGPGAAPGALEVALAHVLQLGTYLSIGLIGVGSVLLFAAGGSPVAGGPPLALDRIIPDVLALRPAGFLWLGIVGVLATPGLRVLRALFGFWRRDEQRMALVALLVLVVVAVGVVAGLLSG